MLFKVDNNDFFLTNPSASSIPEFAECNSNEMKYVAMYVDYLSPIRQQPDGERKRLAALAAGYPPQSTHDKTFQPKVREMINGQKPKVEAAIKKYRELQYNEDRELLRLYQTHIDNIKTIVNSPTDDVDEAKKRGAMLLTIPELRKSQRELARTVGLEDEIVLIQEESIENRKMSTLDKVHNEESKLDD
jgi:hypothetical protein